MLGTTEKKRKISKNIVGRGAQAPMKSYKKRTKGEKKLLVTTSLTEIGSYSLSDLYHVAFIISGCYIIH